MSDVKDSLNLDVWLYKPRGTGPSPVVAADRVQNFVRKSSSFQVVGFSIFGRDLQATVTSSTSDEQQRSFISRLKRDYKSRKLVNVRKFPGMKTLWMDGSMSTFRWTFHVDDQWPLDVLGYRILVRWQPQEVAAVVPETNLERDNGRREDIMRNFGSNLGYSRERDGNDGKLMEFVTAGAQYL
ncbi:hypothetical protein L218DRAFT_951219 [Marasmius fiardii PR-910]|nr:hypothetical protein L218DRAFT_951219 [Marasmius fiardii PR-910]